MARGSRAWRGEQEEEEEVRTQRGNNENETRLATTEPNAARARIFSSSCAPPRFLLRHKPRKYLSLSPNQTNQTTNISLTQLLDYLIHLFIYLFIHSLISWLISGHLCRTLASALPPKSSTNGRMSADIKPLRRPNCPFPPPNTKPPPPPLSRDPPISPLTHDEPHHAQAHPLAFGL